MYGLENSGEQSYHSDSCHTILRDNGWTEKDIALTINNILNSNS